MPTVTLHKRLQNWRDRAIRRQSDLPVYAHLLVIAHREGQVIAQDHPGWQRLEDAIQAARSGDPDALDRIEREFLRLKGRS